MIIPCYVLRFKRTQQGIFGYCHFKELKTGDIIVFEFVPLKDVAARIFA